MYRTWCAALLALVVLAAGCGGKGSSNTGEQGAANAAGGRTDEHSLPKKLLGERDVEGGYKLKVSQLGTVEFGKEGVFEVLVTKDGTVLSDVSITAWLGEKNKELNEIAPGEWRKDIQAHDVHMFVPKDRPAGTKLWVRLKIADKSSWWDFDTAQ